MRPKFAFFMISHFSIKFDNFKQEVNTSIMRSKFANNAFFSFDLMIALLVLRTSMRSKFANNAFLNFDLMIDLLATSVIMRSKLFKFA
jgi:hypothetical protein